jgi:hypothetical protein
MRLGAYHDRAPDVTANSLQSPGFAFPDLPEC